MAKPTILKERGTGEELYPRTLASLVHTSTGENVDEAVEAAKFKVFVDMWKAKGGPDKVSDFNEETKLFKLYDIDDIDYEEALLIDMLSGTPYAARNQGNAMYFVLNNALGSIKIRALFPIGLTAANCANMFAYHRSIEVLAFTGSHGIANVINGASMFGSCHKLRRITGKLEITGDTRGFSNCPALEEVSLYHLTKNVSFADSPLLSLASLQYLVANAANTSAITVTVHKIVYLKLTAEPFKSTCRATGLPVSITTGQANSWFRGGTFPWDNMVVPDGLVTGDTIVVELSINNENNAPAWAIGTVTKIDGTQITIKSIDWSYGAMPTGDTLGGAHQAQWNQVLVDAVAKDISFATL